MSQRYAAFLNYASCHRAWVTALQKNLEACLAAAGKPGKVFRDETDLPSGHSWVERIQEALQHSARLVLIATPEALASPRVVDELEGFIALHRDWKAGRLHVVELIETQLPPFLDPIQRLNFREPGEDRYRSELAKLVAGLLGRKDPRNLPELPPGLTIPSHPGLPADAPIKDIAFLGQPENERRLLDLWLHQVAREHERPVPYFERHGEMDLLEQIYSPLGHRGQGSDAR